MKIKELRELSKDELAARRNELKKQALDSRVQHVGGQLENTSVFRQLRKEVAHIETILSERRLNVQYRGQTVSGVAAAQRSQRETAKPKPAKAARTAAPKKPAAKKKAPAKKAAKAKR
jgi:large subunit ribosomal protein L29